VVVANFRLYAGAHSVPGIIVKSRHYYCHIFLNVFK